MKLIEFRTIGGDISIENGIPTGRSEQRQYRQRMTGWHHIDTEWGLEEFEVLTQEWGEWEDMP